MSSGMSNLILFLDRNSDLKLLISRIQQSSAKFWLVGGCLRNSFLDLPQNDIDICCTGDPTSLTQAWAYEVSAHWFWLDKKRLQSRVLLKDGLTLDFAPLRAPSIAEDLRLRDFTINALALPLKQPLSKTELLDPTGGIDDLQRRRLESCSPKSFSDDPLRMLKGIRHAVTLDFTLSPRTLGQIIMSAHLIAASAGERIREELGKIFAADNIVKGVELLLDSGLLVSIFGAPGQSWDRHSALAELEHLRATVNETGLGIAADPVTVENSEQFSNRMVFFLACLLNHYLPTELSVLLHQRLCFSRSIQRLIEQLQPPPDEDFLSLLPLINGQRREALLVEKIEPFAGQKMVYWSLCDNLLSLQRAEELQHSFLSEQKFGRIPDLLDGRLVATLLGGYSNAQVGEWQEKLKLAEINGEISTATEAEKWLKSKLSFDKKPI